MLKRCNELHVGFWRLTNFTIQLYATYCSGEIVFLNCLSAQQTRQAKNNSRPIRVIDHIWKLEASFMDILLYICILLYARIKRK